jgi:pseudaminic acid cytidylyltransferase
VRNLAIIPARGGSKRIPKKNIKSFLDKYIIQYSIEAAQAFKLFDEIMISTDDDEIAEIGIKFGAKVPFKRSEKNSNDFATLSDVLFEVLTEYQNRDIFFDNVCLILPTSPLTTFESLDKAYQKLINNNFSTVIPVVEFEHPIQRALKLDSIGHVNMIEPKNRALRTQDCEITYYDSGQFYWIKAPDFLREKNILMQRTGSIELMAYQSQDIDTPIGWTIAEMKYKLLIEMINKEMLESA